MRRVILYFISILLVFLSCDDFLDQEPDEQVSINEQLSTKEGVLQAYNGIYRDVEAVFSSKFAVYADALGGNISFAPSILGNRTVSIPGEILFAYNFNANPINLDFESYYDDWYNIINQVNLILEQIDVYSFFSSAERNRLQAELLTLRALAHYQVSLLFAQHYGFTPNASHLGVVYNTRVLTAGVDFPSRETMEQTYILLQSDLDTALNLYNDMQLQSGPNFSYFNHVNTSALYARIALQMDDWTQAKKLSEEVIINSGVNLITTDNYIQEWERNLDDVATNPISEVIMEFTAPLSSDGNVSSTIAENFQFSSSTNYADYVASGDLLNFYTSADIRKNMFVVEAIPTLVSGVETPVNYSFTKKFQGDAGTLFIRLSEMYLIRAEANARLGLTNEALSDVNTIRTRANLTALATTTNLLDEIFLERRRELAFEGHLLFDIVRYQKNVSRNLGCIALLCNVVYPSNFFILPIPQDNVLQNENMQQNEGY